METDIRKLQKQYAALAYSLAAIRGVLSGILDGDFTREQVQRVLHATDAVRIAQSIGVSENAIAVYWDEYLSDAEKHRLKGHDADE